MERERECVYQDFYDVDQRYREEKIAHSIECNSARTDFLMADINTALLEMKGEIKAMNARITNITWTVTLAIIVIGIFLTILLIKAH